MRCNTLSSPGSSNPSSTARNGPGSDRVVAARQCVHVDRFAGAEPPQTSVGEERAGDRAVRARPLAAATPWRCSAGSARRHRGARGPGSPQAPQRHHRGSRDWACSWVARVLQAAAWTLRDGWQEAHPQAILGGLPFSRFNAMTTGMHRAVATPGDPTSSGGNLRRIGGRRTFVGRLRIGETAVRTGLPTTPTLVIGGSERWRSLSGRRIARARNARIVMSWLRLLRSSRV